MSQTNAAFSWEPVTDPVELAAADLMDAQYQRNQEWYQTVATSCYERFRGQVICIVGQEVFAADTVEAAVALAQTAHPGDRGRFILRIPSTRTERIYAS